MCSCLPCRRRAVVAASRDSQPWLAGLLLGSAFSRAVLASSPPPFADGLHPRREQLYPWVACEGTCGPRSPSCSRRSSGVRSPAAAAAKLFAAAGARRRVAAEANLVGNAATSLEAALVAADAADFPRRAVALNVAARRLSQLRLCAAGHSRDTTAAGALVTRFADAYARLALHAGAGGCACTSPGAAAAWLHRQSRCSRCSTRRDVASRPLPPRSPLFSATSPLTAEW